MKMYKLEPAEYSDYRDFLNKRFVDLKEKNPRFSMGALAKKSGISKSLLQFVFKRKRHLSVNKIHLLTKPLHLSLDEEGFIYICICKETSKSKMAKLHFENILARLRHQHIDDTQVSAPVVTQNDEKEMFLNVLFMAIQAMTSLVEFNDDPQWILENLNLPNLNLEKIKRSLKELESAGFLKRDRQGKIIQRELALWRPDPFDPSGQAVFTKAAESMAELMQTPQLYKPSVYMSMSLTFDETTLKEAEKFMVQVHHKLCEISKSSQRPNALAQFANFMLTISRPKVVTR